MACTPSYPPSGYLSPDANASHESDVSTCRRRPSVQGNLQVGASGGGHLPDDGDDRDVSPGGEEGDNASMFGDIIVDNSNAKPISRGDIVVVTFEPPPYQDTMSTKDDEDFAIEAFRTGSIASVLHRTKDRRMSTRMRLRRVMLSLELQLFLVIVVLVDLTCFLTELGLSEETLQKELGPVHTRDLFLYINWLTLLCYLNEAILGFIAFGLRTYLRDGWKMLDVAIIVLAIALVEGPGGVVVLARLGKAARFLNLIAPLHRCILRLVLSTKRFHDAKLAVKRKVSQNKFRYIDPEENIDLDLTYITTELIAMGVPVRGFWIGLYRNPLRDVVRFFSLAHPDTFRIYSACPELPYPSDPFGAIGGEVVRFQVHDHTPPMMDQFVEFLINAREWRAGNDKNIIAVHCKAGKGRTGCFCSAWLLYTQKRPSAKEALKMFAQRRTDQRISPELRGVETPSQVRYVYQLAAHLQRTESWISSKHLVPKVPEPSVRLHKLSFHNGLLAKPQKIKQIRVLVQSGGVNVQDVVLETSLFDASTTEFDLEGVEVRGDVRISLFEKRAKYKTAHEAMKKAPNAYDAMGVVLFFLFHTNFMPWGKGDHGSCESLGDCRDNETHRAYKIGVEDLDKAHKNVRKGVHQRGSYLLVHFSAGSSGSSDSTTGVISGGASPVESDQPQAIEAASAGGGARGASPVSCDSHGSGNIGPEGSEFLANPSAGPSQWSVATESLRLSPPPLRQVSVSVPRSCLSSDAAAVPSPPELPSVRPECPA